MLQNNLQAVAVSWKETRSTQHTVLQLKKSIKTKVQVQVYS